MGAFLKNLQMPYSHLQINYLDPNQVIELGIFFFEGISHSDRLRFNLGEIGQV